MSATEELPPTIEGAPSLTAVTPPPGSPDEARRQAGQQAAPAPMTTSDAAPAVAVLEFVTAAAQTIRLQHPFRLDGRLVDCVHVRRLSLAQVSELVVAGRTGDLYEVYAVMCDLAAPVLRGLDGDDGEAVVEAAYDFLPRVIRAAHG